MQTLNLFLTTFIYIYLCENSTDRIIVILILGSMLVVRLLNSNKNVFDLVARMKNNIEYKTANLVSIGKRKRLAHLWLDENIDMPKKICRVANFADK